MSYLTIIHIYGVILLKQINHISQFYRKEHIKFNIHDFMLINFIFKFDDVVKFNSITFIHRFFYTKLLINLQIRLIKNKNYYNKFIRNVFRTYRNLFSLTNIGV